jgi:hypothetical protein
VAGNEANFFIRDVINGSRLPFRIRPCAPSDSLFIASDGDVGLGTQSPGAKLEIDQGGDDDEILALKSSDVAHGMTSRTETDTFGVPQKEVATAGVLRIVGYGEQSAGLEMFGRAVSDKTSKAANSWGYFTIRGEKKTGTSTVSVGTDGNILAINNYTNMVAVFDAEGELHLEATLSENAWDEYDDPLLIRAARASLMPEDNPMRQQFAEIIEQSRPILKKDGVVTYNEDGHHFLSMKQWTMLLADGVWQLAERLEKQDQEQQKIIEELEAQKAELEERVAALEALVTSLVQGQTE